MDVLWWVGHRGASEGGVTLESDELLRIENVEYNTVEEQRALGILGPAQLHLLEDQLRRNEIQYAEWLVRQALEAQLVAHREEREAQREEHTARQFEVMWDIVSHTSWSWLLLSVLLLLHPQQAYIAKNTLKMK